MNWHNANPRLGTHIACQIEDTPSLPNEVPMHYPFMALCIDREGNLVITHQRDPTRKRPLEMEIPLAELQEKGLDGAAHSIGTLALSLLSMWYPEQFAEYPLLKPEIKAP